MNKLVTFDFDDTLCITYPGIGWAPDVNFLNPGILNKYKEHKDAGDSVNILTTRMDKNMPEVHKFIEQNELEFDNVWNTNFQWKADTLIEKGVDVHYDDNPEEIINLINEQGATQMYFVVENNIYKVDKDIKLPKEAEEVWRKRSQ